MKAKQKKSLCQEGSGLEKALERAFKRLAAIWDGPLKAEVAKAAEIAALYREHRKEGLTFQKIADGLTAKGRKVSEAKVRAYYKAYLLWDQTSPADRKRLRSLDWSHWMVAGHGLDEDGKPKPDEMPVPQRIAKLREAAGENKDQEEWTVDDLQADLAGWRIEEVTRKRPKVETGGGAEPVLITLVEGNCLPYLRSLPDASFDCIVTSPPYNCHPKKRWKGTGMYRYNKWIAKMRMGYEDSLPEPEYQAWLREVVTECMRVCRGLVWVQHKTRFVSGIGIHPRDIFPASSFPLVSEAIQQGGHSMDLTGGRVFAVSHFHWVAFGKRHPEYRPAAHSMSSVIEAPVVKESAHPCPLPPEAVRPLVRLSCPPGGRVLDPFAGIGTVMEVAAEEGRRSVGVELSPKWFHQARGRLRKMGFQVDEQTVSAESGLANERFAEVAADSADDAA